MVQASEQGWRRIAYCQQDQPTRRKKKNTMPIETMPEMDGHKPDRQAVIPQKSPTIIRSPYPDVAIPEVSLPAFVLEQAELEWLPVIYT
jgi:hypothetical protein